MIRLPPYQPNVSKPIWDIQLSIRGVIVRYRLEFRARCESWYMSVWLAGDAVVLGKRLSEGSPPIWRYRPDALLEPAGYLGYLIPIAAALDSSELATQDGLGWTHHLWWLDRDELNPEDVIVVSVT